VSLGPRASGYRVLSDTFVTPANAQALSEAANACHEAILQRDVTAFGQAFTASLSAQVAMFPHMLTDSIRDLIETYRATARGWKLSGAGGGGYLILVSEEPVPGSLQIKIRRQHATF
jgi:galactokinase/mevalonate kinase-like predicted kinase